MDVTIDQIGVISLVSKHSPVKGSADITNEYLGSVPHWLEKLKLRGVSYAGMYCGT